jgi:aquaporin related protein
MRDTRSDLVAVTGEFVGTFLFLFFAYAGTQVANTALFAKGVDRVPSLVTILFIALSFGFSLLVNAWMFYRICGSAFNPAVTLGLALIGAIGWLRAAMMIVAQILGAIVAAAVVSGLFPGVGHLSCPNSL